MQELASIRREQFRHWRKTLPPLQGRDGRAEGFTFAEVLALATVAKLVDDLGIAVAHLKVTAAEIFAFFSENEEFAALPAVLHITTNGQLSVVEPPSSDVFLSVRPLSIYTSVRDRLTPEVRRQLALPLL